MDILYLPITEWNDSLQTAMQRMKSFDSRWLVVHYQDDRYMLHANLAVLDARAKGVEQCDGLRDFPGEPVALLADDLARNRADWIWQLVENTLDQKNANYGLPFLQSYGNQVIAVVTRHETIGDDMRSRARVCKCGQGHGYSEPPAVDGTGCQHDDTLIVCL